MTWIKQGRIFHLEPAPNRSTHCQVPTPYVMENKIRVYYSCRNNGKSFIAYFDLAKDLKTILKVHEQTVFEHGKPGMFDADGVMPSCAIEKNGEIWLYYIGWSELKNTARYQNEIGLAVSKDGGETFERKFHGPIIGRSPTEPGLAVMPCVVYRNWFRMWYQSLTSWVLIDGKYEPVYVIKYAESVNGMQWSRNPEQCVKSNFNLEAFSRPAVIFKDDKYLMWFCYRASADYRGGNGSYRIGFAQSSDGIKFERDDSFSGIEVGDKGDWDSEMMSYPAICEIDGKYVMFYNGNSFGQTGIGVAIWN